MVYTDDVENRLFFAKRRLEELESLNKGDLAGAKSRDRQQLVQEFFFHLVGAIYFLMPLINNSRNLGLSNDGTHPRAVYDELGTSDPIKPILDKLFPRIGRGSNRRLLPRDPYSEEGCHFRILIYRHWITHEKRNPWHFSVGGDAPRSSLKIDLRDEQGLRKNSEKSVFDELNTFWKLVTVKIQDIIHYL